MPYGVELVSGSIHQHWIIDQNARFEIVGRRVFHAGPCADQIGGTYVSDLIIENQYLEVYAQTQSPLQSAPQKRVFVEIVGEVPSRPLGMDQPYLDTTANQILQHLQQRNGRRTPPVPEWERLG